MNWVMAFCVALLTTSAFAAPVLMVEAVEVQRTNGCHGDDPNCTTPPPDAR